MDIDSLTKEIDDITASFSKDFGRVDHVKLNHKHNPETWSIAQNIDHLMVINRSYFPIIKGLKDGTYSPPWHARFGFFVNFFGNLILKSVNPDRRKKMKTLPVWEPAVSDLPADIVQRFSNHQEELKKIIREAKPLIDQGAVIESPANRIIVYDLARAFEIMVTHEKRHLEQAREVLAPVTTVKY